MKKIALISLSAFVLISLSLSSIWKIASTEDVKINFHLTVEGTKGTFGGLETVFEFDKSNFSKSKITANIDVNTLNTNNKKRDEHLKSEDFFEAKKYPKIIFTSKEFSKTDKGYIVKGDLTMKNVTKPIEVPFTFEDSGNKAIFKGIMNVYPSEFGVMKDKKGDKEKVEISIEVPFVK
jgi:polyisoprenoid-binding protein YceI